MEAGLFYPQYPQYPQIEWVKDLLDKERQQFAKEELKFLNGKDIRWLVHEADIGACHENCEALEKHKKYLKELID